MSGPSTVVIDASVAIAIARNEPAGAVAGAAIDRWTREGVRIVVPSHFWLEVANVLQRRHRWGGAAVFEAIHELDRLAFETAEVDRPLLLSAIDLSERFGLSAYDAAYLALTDALGGTLFTLDRALRAAAGSRAASPDRHRLSEPPATYEHAVTWPNYKRASAYLAKLRAEAARPSEAARPG
jgi:predicted nucleic acid-binding protein